MCNPTEKMKSISSSKFINIIEKKLIKINIKNLECGNLIKFKDLRSIMDSIKIIISAIKVVRAAATIPNLLTKIRLNVKLKKLAINVELKILRSLLKFT